MRISKLIQIGRFEGYIGRRPHWSPDWRADRVAHGYALTLGHWHLIGCWLPSKRVRARRNAEWLAEMGAKLDAAALAKARTSWPDRATP